MCGSPPYAVYAAATHGSHRRRGSAPRPRGAGTVRRQCAQGPDRGRREAAECCDEGNSSLRDSSQEGRRRRPAGSPRRSTRRPRLANRKTEDERARCCSSPGAVTSARTPAHARRRKPIGLTRRWVQDGTSTRRLSHACASSSLGESLPNISRTGYAPFWKLRTPTWRQPFGL